MACASKIAADVCFYIYMVQVCKIRQPLNDLKIRALGGGESVSLHAVLSGQEGQIPFQWALPLPFMWLMFDLVTSVL